MRDTEASATAYLDQQHRSGSPEMRRALRRWCRSTATNIVPILTVRPINVPCADGACVQVRLVAELSGRRIEILETRCDGLSALSNALKRLSLRLGDAQVSLSRVPKHQSSERFIQPEG